jgi:hypothetical protein
MDNPNDYLLNKVIFVGVPHLGAPKAVKTLVAGDGFGVPGLSHLEMKKLAANFPVVYDLLPTPKYFATKGSYASILRLSGLGANIQDLDYDETGNFLTQDHDLNQLAYNRAQELHTIQFDNFDVRQRGIDVYNFAGCDSAGTIGKITEIRQGGIGSFAAGYDIKYVPGDQTVPLESATNTPVDADKRYFALKVGHGDLLSNVDTRREMVNIFQDQANAETYEKLTHDIGRCNLKGKAIAIFSPLTIEVTDQFGRVTRQTEVDTVENAIPGVYLDVIGDHKFLWIPEDENQYALRVQGTGVGTFTLRSTVALAKFIEQYNIVSSATLHTFTGAVLYPWGLSTRDTKTSYDTIFVKMGRDAAVESQYKVGNSAELIYPANGTFEDYAFWRLGIWSMLFELGRTHTPTDSEIQKMAQVNVPGLRRMFALGPKQRAFDHDFKGRCQRGFGAFDRHDE